MANYSLVINSQFKPFSYQEMLAPVLMATEAHQALEDAYGELSTKASVWENMANEQTDPKAYRQYKKYADDLKHQADILVTEGLSVTSRGALNNIRARYSSDIVPIEQAYQARAEEAKAQYAGRAQGMVYEGDAANSSLDRYLGNPQVRYNQANSQEGFKRLGSAAAALAKGLADYGRGKNIDSYTGTFLQRYGYTGANIAQAINDVQRIMQGDTNIQTNGVLRALLKDEMDIAGVSSWNNQSAKMDYFNRVAPALYQAVGQTSVAPLPLFAERLAAEEASANRRARYAKSLEGPQLPDGPVFPTDPINLPIGAANPLVASAQVDNRYASLGYNKDKKNFGIVHVPTRGWRTVNSEDKPLAVLGSTVEADLFMRSKNRLKTRQEFINSAKEKGQRKAYADYYDTYVQPILNRYNNGRSSNIGQVELFKYYTSEMKDAIKKGTSTFTQSYLIPTGTIDETIKATTNIANDRAYKMSLGDTQEGWKLTDGSKTVGELLREAKENNKDVNIYWTAAKNQEGIVINTKDEQYLVPLRESSRGSAKEALYGMEQLGKSSNEFDRQNYIQGITSRLNYMMGGVYNRPDFETSYQKK